MNTLQTGKVIWFCGTNDGKASDCVEWAENALGNGFDSMHLRILAGLEAPLNQFEVREYAEKALNDLSIELQHGALAVLHCTYTDFEYGEVQHYWGGATKRNIDSITLEGCRKYVVMDER
jgi:hypothetical protein